MKDKKGRHRPLIKSPNWMRRIPVGAVVEYELLKIESISPKGAWIIVGGPEKDKRNVTRIYVRNPF